MPVRPLIRVFGRPVWIRGTFAAFVPHSTMTKTATKKQDVAGRTPESETNDSSLPIWKNQHNRVQGAMWKYLQKDGKPRFTISISRSYKDKADDEWKSVHYFDRKDLNDIRAICDEAEEHLLSASGMAREVSKD